MGTRLSAQERIILHLYDFVRFEEEAYAPYAVSQNGIADRTGILRSHVPRTVKKLMAQGLVKERLSRVRGGGRSRRVYFLTWEGQLAGRELRERLEREPVALASQSGAIEATAGDVVSKCKNAGLLDVLLAAEAGPIDPQTLRGRTLREGLVERLEGAPSPAPFFGRKDELRVLMEWLEGEARVVSIFGPAGIGKSSLALELLRQLKGRRHALWLVVHEWDTLQGIVRPLSAFLSATGRKKLAAALEAPGPPELSQVHEILVGELGGLEAIIVIDDLQKASPELLRGIRALVDAVLQTRGPRLLLLSRERRELAGASRGAPDRVRELALGGLDEESALSLLGTSLPPDERKAALEAAGGNPLYLQLLAKSGIGAGKGALMEHIKRELLSTLSEEERKVLAATSVHSSPVPAPALICDGAGPDAIDSLLGKGILRVSSDGLYTMHDILREIVRARLSPAEKRVVHLRAALHLLSSKPLKEEAALEALCHLINAGDKARAVEETLRHGERLLETGFCGPLLSEVLKVIEEKDCGQGQWREILLLRARALAENGDRDGALRDYAGVASGGDALAAAALLGSGQILEERSDWEGAENAYAKAAELDEGQRDAALRGCARVAWRRGRWEEAQRLFNEALRLAKRRGRRALSASILTDMANLESDRGATEEALSLYNRALRVLEEERNRREAARVHNNLGAVLFYEQRWEEALEHYQRSLELSEGCGDVSTKAYALSNIGQILARRAEEERALRYLDESSRIFERLGDEYMVSTNLLAKGILYRALRDWERSDAFFKQGIRLLERLDIPKELAEAEFEYGLMLKERGDGAAARRRLESALATYRRLGAAKEQSRVEGELRKLK
ncbi:MAG: tetratricopeptide repeat protein [Thermoplasmata archaeon]